MLLQVGGTKWEWAPRRNAPNQVLVDEGVVKSDGIKGCIPDHSQDSQDIHETWMVVSESTTRLVLCGDAGSMEEDHEAHYRDRRAMACVKFT